MSIVATIAVLFFGLVIGMQLLVRHRAKAMQGRPIPPIPGPLGKQVRSEKSALLYFMSPNCGACRAWTPRLKSMGQKNHHVHVIDVSTQLDVARALNVMATPSAVEILDGKVAGYYVGAIPAQVLERFEKRLQQA